MKFLIAGLFVRKACDPQDLNSELISLLTFQGSGIPIIPETIDCHNQLQLLTSSTSICIKGEIQKDEDGYQYLLAEKAIGV